jgi:hypothetical protein
VALMPAQPRNDICGGAIGFATLDDQVFPLDMAQSAQLLKNGCWTRRSMGSLLASLIVATGPAGDDDRKCGAVLPSRAQAPVAAWPRAVDRS